MFFFHKRYIPDNPGWLEDPVDTRDYKYEEIFGSPPAVQWKPIDPRKIEPLLPIKNQDNSSSCVAQALSKAMEYLEYRENNKPVGISARGIYSRKKIQQPGMAFRNALDIARKYGSTLEELMPSQGLNEQRMLSDSDYTTLDKEVGQILRIKNYVWANNNFDTLAGLLLNDVPILLGVRMSRNGWLNGMVRPPKPGEPITGHGLVIIPKNKTGYNFGLVNGKKSLIFDNSWTERWGFRGQGVISEGYGYMWNYAIYDLPDDWRDTEEKPFSKPQHTFQIDLYYGLKNDEEVKWLQHCLKWLGLFPLNVPETGNYYSITQKAVQDFQDKYDIAHQGNPGYGRCGPKTRTQLNKIFG